MEKEGVSTLPWDERRYFPIFSRQLYWTHSPWHSFDSTEYKWGDFHWLMLCQSIFLLDQGKNYSSFWIVFYRFLCSEPPINLSRGTWKVCIFLHTYSLLLPNRLVKQGKKKAWLSCKQYRISHVTGKLDLTLSPMLA